MAMSELPSRHEQAADNNVVQFERPKSSLRPLYASDMSDIEIAAALGLFDHEVIRQTAIDKRPIVILGDLLIALNVTEDINDLFTAEHLNPSKKEDARHISKIQATITRVRNEYEELSSQLNQRQMADFRDEMLKRVTDEMSDTNLYRAFNQLKESVDVDQDVKMNGLVQAHQLAYELLYDQILSRDK